MQQALVTINENQWSVEVATTTSELITGLSGRASIPAGTGMLFVLPARQVVTVDTSQMLFPIDIIFIKDDAVLSIAPNIPTGYLVEEATPIDMFLEVNANEAELLEVGDIVSTVSTQEPAPVGFDISQIISFIIPLALLGFIFAVLGIMRGSGSSSSSSPKRLGEPKTEKERKETHYSKYGTKELPVRGSGLTEREGWTYAKVGDTEMRGKLTPDGMAFEQVSPSYDRSDLDKAVEIITETLKQRRERGKGQEEYYWEIADIDTGEIIQKGKPYTSISKVYRSARDYQRRRPGKDKENLVVIRIFDTPVMEEWGKTIKPVMESGMHRGIPILIGKTPLQEEALDRLWPYRVLEIHSDGDLTIGSASKKYVVTTEGGVFSEEPHSIHGEPRRRLVEQYGSWSVGRAEAICPEGDVTCVEREAKRLIETLRARYGEEPMRYVTIVNSGATVFHPGDTVSIVALERENRRVRELGEKEATYK